MGQDRPYVTSQAGEPAFEGPPDGETRITVDMDRDGANAVQRWTFNLIMDAFLACKERLAKSAGLAKQPTAKPARPGQEPRIHIVRPGDWLSKIALTYYGDMNKWRVIYDHPQNRQTIGPNYNLIKPGQRLVIP
jgi:LysM domain